MKIAAPPSAAGSFISLHKQMEVASRVYDPVYDEVLYVAPASAEDLFLAHDPSYVRDLLAGRAENGFGTADERVTQHALHSVGAMVTAARSALRHKVAFAPVSGFHHAHYAYAQGYCTFNGLIVAAMKMVEENLAKRILILDGDAHWGDGTADIIRQKGYADHIENVDYRDLEAAIDVAKLFAAKPDLVLYQAGADAHEDDSYGAGYLDDIAWRRRDNLVFHLAQGYGVPIAWNLAGGYNGDKTISLHMSTFESAVQVYEPGQTRLPSEPDALSRTIAGLNRLAPGPGLARRS